MRAAVYTRLSRVNPRDEEQGTVTGVQRQAEDAEAYCARQGWTAVGLFNDYGLSAWNGRERAEFTKLVKLVSSGGADVLVAWKFDRLTRNFHDYALLYAACKSTGTRIIGLADGVDTSTPAGEMVATILFAVAKNESDTISMRGTRKHEALAKQGRMGGRGYRAFGYTPDRSAIIDSEADLIRAAAWQILNGATMSSIKNRWNADGVTTPVGNPWTVASLRQMFVSAHLAGIRTHRGRHVAKAVWEPILDEVTHRALVRKLTAKTVRAGARSYPLTGLVFCGRCGHNMVGRRRDNGRGQYGCRHGDNLPNCGRTTVMAIGLEEFVVHRVAVELDSGRLAAAFDGHDDTAGPLSDLTRAEEGLSDLAAMWAAGELTQPEWREARRVLAAAREHAERQVVASAGRDRASLPESGEAFVATWESADVGERRALLGQMIERIEVGPGRAGLRGFDPDRVSMEWRL